MDLTMILRTQLSKMLLMCGAGLSVQLMASGFEMKHLEKALQMAQAQAGEEQAAGAVQGKMLNVAVSVAVYDQRAQGCEAAKRQALEVAPALLALSAWPLDENEPAECLDLGQDQLAALGDSLPVVELAEHSSVASVMASEYGAAVFDERVSNERISLISPAVDQLNASLKESLNEAESPANQHPLGQQLAALDTGSLDEIRGGFELDGTGLKFSFGIERAVFINGELIASTTLNLRDLQVTAGVGGAASAVPSGAAGALGIVQNGAGNSVATTITPNMVGTVIQNSLDNQKIQNVTTINASVNSLQAVRAISVQSAIQSGIIGSLRR